MLNTPVSRYKYQGGTWAADSGCFNAKTYPGDDAWWSWLESQVQHVDTCLFATAPDIVGDHEATLERSLPWLSKIRALGYPAAFVGQDGATVETVPWDEFDWLFIGGTTEWKLGPVAAEIAAEAKSRGKGVHMGRVNSELRIRYAHHIGCDTADGTFIGFHPGKNLPAVMAWMRGINDQMELI